MRKPLLIASAALALLAGCGQDNPSQGPPRNLDQGLYVICSGKPRYCAVADTRKADPEWQGAEELDPEQTRRLRSLVGPTPVPLRPG